MARDLYAIEVETIAGETESVSKYRGKVLLIVNTASKCGFTPQYEGLEALYQEYADQGLMVLGFPCDQFGHQEPGSEEEILDFCTTRFDVSFPMHAKVEVNGADQHPLYALLESEARHFADYLALAERYAAGSITERLSHLLDAERELIESPDPEFRFHSGPPPAGASLSLSRVP